MFWTGYVTIYQQISPPIRRVILSMVYCYEFVDYMTVPTYYEADCHIIKLTCNI